MKALSEPRRDAEKSKVRTDLTDVLRNKVTGAFAYQISVWYRDTNYDMPVVVGGFILEIPDAVHN